MKNPFRVGNCAGFSGDRVDAPGPVVDTLIEAGGPGAVFFVLLLGMPVRVPQRFVRPAPWEIDRGRTRTGEESES